MKQVVGTYKNVHWNQTRFLSSVVKKSADIAKFYRNASMKDGEGHTAVPRHISHLGGVVVSA
jgi:hypothetical protein